MESNSRPYEDAASFPLPVRVIDEILPTLKDTELRLLLVVLRQTWGRVSSDGTRRKADWLSHRQLQERTGRASEAISAAIDVLVKRGLLNVSNSFGRTLDTPRARQQARARLLFAPGRILDTHRRAGSKGTIVRISDPGKSKMTYRGIDNSHFRKSAYEGQSASESEDDSDNVRSENIEEIKAAIRERFDRLKGPITPPLRGR